jgi:hypothetical protein
LRIHSRGRISILLKMRLATAVCVSSSGRDPQTGRPNGERVWVAMEQPTVQAAQLREWVRRECVP